MDKGRRCTQICVWKWNPANFISMFHTPSCFSLFVIILLFPLLSLSLSDNPKLFRYPSNYYRSVMHEVYKFSQFFVENMRNTSLKSLRFFRWSYVLYSERQFVPFIHDDGSTPDFHYFWRDKFAWNSLDSLMGTRWTQKENCRIKFGQFRKKVIVSIVIVRFIGQTFKNPNLSSF